MKKSDYMNILRLREWKRLACQNLKGNIMFSSTVQRQSLKSTNLWSGAPMCTGIRVKEDEQRKEEVRMTDEEGEDRKVWEKIEKRCGELKKYQDTLGRKKQGMISPC